MTLTQVWGALLIFTLCPLIGGLPLIAWMTYRLTGSQLNQIGTRNVSVSAAFYHGGRLAGILAVLSEAFKGIAVVLLARYFFPINPEWELIALIMLVLGRYWIGKGAGTTNVVWGFVVHQWQVALLVFLIGGVSFTILRDRNSSKIGVLILFPLILALLHPNDSARIVSAIALGLLLGWIYRQIPDDLDLTPNQAQTQSQSMLRFFRGDQAIISLDHQLDANKVGQKAATLSQLKRWGYAVPMGWVLPPGDDGEPLVKYLPVSPTQPLIVRSSAIGEDSEIASAAGQYQSILNVTTRAALAEAIRQVLASYHHPSANQYREDLAIANHIPTPNLPHTAMAVLIQKQIPGVFSGVAFSRDPISQQGDTVIIEALPGDTTRIVSGRVTPEQYQINLPNSNSQLSANKIAETDTEIQKRSDAGRENAGKENADKINVLPINPNKYQQQNPGNVPSALIQQVAILAREIENRYHGIPQDIEWTYDGQQLWLLQTRPITTLQPIWTRKIAAEVIPGLIRPLTWSINRPLTCSVWGEIFTLVLGKRAQGLDFNQTATLHSARAYFNATLLSNIFRRMGLPAESLEFLTRGAKFSPPSWSSTLQNVPGLLRLIKREWNLERDFDLDYRQSFAPTLNQIKAQPASELSSLAILERVELILAVLKRVTYYSILAPLSLAWRQALLKVKDEELDRSQLPEVASLRSLQKIAQDADYLLNIHQINCQNHASIFSNLAEIPDGRSILEQFEQFLAEYGYLSDVATDIAIPTWQEEPQAVRQLFAQFLCEPPAIVQTPQRQRMPAELVQARLDLKGQVSKIYSQLLAELRWSFIALEKLWLESGLLGEAGDIFFLEFSEVKRQVNETEPGFRDSIGQLVEKRRSQFHQHTQITNIPP